MSCYAIGLTGGIASGKSTVSDRFKLLGCYIIDADVVAREVVTKNSEGLKQLIQVFGEKIITKDAKLDRAKLRKIVFNDKEKLTVLNSILHPLINQKIVQQINDVTSSFCIIVIPLLCESDLYDWLDRVLVVDVKEQTQLSRLLQRDNITNKLAKKMMRSQCSRDQRLSIADDVINNEQSLATVYENVENLYRLYKTL